MPTTLLMLWHPCDGHRPCPYCDREEWSEAMRAAVEATRLSVAALAMRLKVPGDDLDVTRALAQLAKLRGALKT